MDYFENAQIGGYRIEMPFPQLFYPEVSSADVFFQYFNFFFVFFSNFPLDEFR